MKISIISAFPESFENFNHSIVKRAKEKGVVDIQIIDLKNFGAGKWHKIDDKPFGGGHGMLLQVKPIYNAIKSLGIEPSSEKRRKSSTQIFLTSAKGQQWNQKLAQKFSEKLEHMILICGHYEGVDNRVVEHIIDGEFRIGPYILSGGEIPAQVIVDSIVRLLPDALGNDKSAIFETTFDHESSEILEHEVPQYTRPAKFEAPGGQSWDVPEVLLSGDPKKIKDWERKHR